MERIKVLAPKVLAVFGAIGVIVGTVLGSIQLIEWMQGRAQDPIRLDASCSPAPIEGVVQRIDHNRGSDYYFDNGLVTYSYPAVYMNVASQAKDGTVQLAPYLIVDVTDIRPMPEKVNYVVTTTPGAGGGYDDWFTATLSPERNGMFSAPQAQLSTSPDDKSAAPIKVKRKNFDYFELKPNETEYFYLYIALQAGYYYHFRVGVQYSYEGTEGTKWMEEACVAGAPIESDNITVWTATYGQPFQKCETLKCLEEFREYNGYSPPEHPDEEKAKKAIVREKRAIQSYRTSFTLPKQISE